MQRRRISSVGWKIFLQILPIIFLFFILTGCNSGDEKQKARQFLDRAQSSLEKKKTDDAVIWLRKALQQDDALAEAHYQLGRIYRARGELGAAYEELNSAVRLDKNFAAAKKELILLLAGRKDGESTLKHCDQYLKNVGDDPDVLRIKGNTLVDINKTFEAVTLLRQAIAKWPKNTMLRVSLARALLASGNMEESRKILDAVERQASGDMHGQLAIAALYGKLGAPTRQLDILEKLCRDFPKSSTPYIALARMRLQAGDTRKAEAILNKAVASGIETAEIQQMLGLIAHGMHQDRAAEHHLQRAVALSTPKERTGSRLLLVDYYINSKRLSDARSLLEHYIHQGNTEKELYYKLVDIYLLQGNADKAKQVVKDLISRQGQKNALIHVLQGKILAEKKEFREARKEFALAMGKAPDSGEIRFLYGLTFLGQSNTISMTEISKALKQNPNMIKAYFVLAELYAKDGQFAKALDNIGQVLSRQADNEQAQVLQIKLLVKTGKNRQALRACQSLVTQHPDKIDYSFQLADLLLKNGNPDQALAIYRKLHDRQPENVKILAKLVNMYFRTWKYEQALAAVDRLMQLTPKDIRPLVIKAQIYMAQKQWDRAEKLLTTAAQKAPRKSIALITLGNLYRLTGKPNQAVTVWNRALKLDPGQVSLARKLGELYMELGRNEQAIRMYEQVIRKQGSSLPILNNLLYLYTKTGQNQHRAMEIADKLTDMATKNSAVADTMGCYYMQQHKYRQADMYLRLALRDQPDNAYFLFHIGELRYRQNQKQEAAEYLRQALKENGLEKADRKTAKEILAKMN